MAQWTTLERTNTINEVKEIYDQCMETMGHNPPFEAKISFFEQVMTNLRGMSMAKNMRR